MEYVDFEFETGDRMKLLKKDSTLLLNTSKMPIFGGLLICSLELEEVNRRNNKLYVASINFPTYRARSFALSNTDYQKEYGALRDKLWNGKDYDVFLNDEGLVEILFLGERGVTHSLK